MAEEFHPVEAPPKKGMNPWIIVAIIFVVLVCCCLATFVLLAILGPAVGTVFSNIIEELATPTLSISTWRELLPMVRVILRLYDSFIFIWFIVVFIAMAFGIVNTLLMAVFERIREFGLLKALGVKPGGIIRGVLTESFLLLVLGTATGNLLGMLTVLPLSRNGIDLSSLAAGLEYVGLPRIIIPVVKPLDFFYANSVVLVLGHHHPPP